MKENNLLCDNKNIYSLGIDQGYANLGYAIIRYNIHKAEYKIIEYGTITTSPKNEIQDRLCILYDKLDEIINRYNLDMMACERLFTTGEWNAGGKKRNKSVDIVKTNMSTGIIFLLSAKHHLRMNDFAPTTVKKQLTGYGKANKEEIIKVVEKLMAKQNLKVKTNHESDAIAIGITCISSFINRLLDY